MSLKINKSSIFTRLSVLYAVLAFLLILVSSMMLYYILVHNIRQRDNGFVIGEIHTLENILRNSSHGDVKAALNQEVILEPRTSLDHYLVRIKSDGEILTQTPKFDQLKLSPNSKSYILRSKTFVVGGKKYLIEVALDVTESKMLINRYQRNLLLAFFLNILFSSFLGYFITAAGIRPLKKMNQSLGNIQVDELGRRLSIDDLPKELREMARGINDLLSRVESAFARLSQFSSDLSHELRTPLNNIIFQSEIMLTKERSKEDYSTALVSNLDECQKLSRLIDQILFIARAKDPHKILRITQVSFNAVANSLVEYFDVLAKEKSIVISVSGESVLSVDVDLFKRAVSNLLANALKYTSEGGHIELKAIDGNNETVISVSDTGIGIDSSHIPHLFDRFYRISDSRSRNDGGSGLGLAIVKSIMLLHKGTVSVESQPGHGTVFKLIFPHVKA